MGLLILAQFNCLLMAMPIAYRPYASIKHIELTAKKATHERCLAWVKKIESRALMKNTIPMTFKVYTSSAEVLNSIAENPNAATDIICQQKRSVPFVKWSLPSKCGILSRLNKRINIYFSPRNEWANPINIRIIEAINIKTFHLRT